MTVTAPQVQIKVDWVNNPIGWTATAGSNFTDISAYVRLDQPISITRGRQDNISNVQPGRCTFTVDNSTGRFTPGNSSSPYYPGVILGRRVQVNVKDEAGTYHTRFDGQINEIDVNDVATGHDTTATIICTDVIAYLNRYPEFSCWTVEQAAVAGDILVQYVMNEPANSQGISDVQGNGPLLPLYTYVQPQRATSNSGATTVTNSTAAYQSGSSPVEGAVQPTISTGMTTPISSQISSPLPSVEFSATITTGGVAAPWGSSAQFQGPLPQNITINASSNYTFLCWVWPDVGLANIYDLNYNQEIMALGNTRTGAMVSIESFMLGNSSSFGSYQASYYPNYNIYNSTGTSTGYIGNSTWFGGPTMLAVVITGTTATMYACGNLYATSSPIATGTMTIPSGTSFNYLTIGGGIGGGNGFLGNISNACVYTNALSTDDIQFLGALGGAGPTFYEAGGIVNTILGFTGVPPYWYGTVDDGAGTVDYFDLTGSQPFSALETVQQVELGLVFTNAAGALTFHSRDRRMGQGAPVVTLPAGSYNEGIAPKWNDQYLQNYAAIQNERGGVPVVVQDATSIAQYGTYPNGSMQSATIVPVYTWYGGFYVKQVASPTTAALTEQYDQYAFADTAAWGVNTQSQPGMKLASIQVDLLSNKTGQNEYVAPSTIFGLEIDNCIAIGQNLGWWPNSLDSSELFIEGVNETYSTTQAMVEFYTSPAVQSRAWVPQSSAYGQLDVSARLGAFNQVPDPQWSTHPIYTFSTTMNSTDGLSNGYVSARDVRGIWANLQLNMQPPLVFTSQTVNTQSVPNATNTYLVWDTSSVDTVNAMNQYKNGATAAIIWQEGWYEIGLTVQFAANNTGDRRCWIVQNQTFALRYLAPAATRGTGTGATALSTSAVIYCYSGDAIAAMFYQDSGSALATNISYGGSHMSLRWLGQGSIRN